MIIYKIRSKKTGEFSKGGGRPSFSKKGKIWNGKGPLSLHFNNLGPDGRDIYKAHDVEVITYELSETECFATSYTEYFEAANQRKADREAADKARWDKYEQDRKRKLFEELKKEFT